MYEKEVRVIDNFIEKSKSENKNITFADLIKELNY
jgi:hypothetical protein